MAHFTVRVDRFFAATDILLAVVSTRAATLSGTVRDSEGAVVSNADVIVHWDSSGSNYLKDNLGIKQDIAATNDSNRHSSPSGKTLTSF